MQKARKRTASNKTEGKRAGGYHDGRLLIAVIAEAMAPARDASDGQAHLPHAVGHEQMGAQSHAGSTKARVPDRIFP